MMPTLLDLPKTPNKPQEFVEKQIEQARQRIRLLDWFSAGLRILIGAFAVLFAALLVDHYVGTPVGSGWAALTVFGGGVAGYLYLTLYRPGRRQINPIYAARQVEHSIPDAKNSVINYIDLKDDEKVPGSVMAAIGVRAARDLRHVDLNRIIRKRQIVWLASIAGLFFAAAVVAVFLPPTRTTMVLLIPNQGNTTILQGEDFRLEVELKGRVPAKTDPDAARVRLWYNPDDPATYEERPLELVEGQKRVLGLTVPARQVRNGFRYTVLAGNARSADFEVKVHIIPQFTGWIAEYAYPEYLQRPPEKRTDDPRLVGFYNTTVTLTALTNRPVKSGEIEIKGQIETIPGALVPDNPEAIVFRVPMRRNGHYRVHFVTTDGHRNPDPPVNAILLQDPKPLFLNYDVTYKYPEYLRAEPVTINLHQPDLEALRGTKVTLVAHANRPVKKATIEFPGYDEPIAGELDATNPLQVKFTQLSMMNEGDYRIAFWPKTDEEAGTPGVFKVRILTDQGPRVQITSPIQELTELPANGVLAVEGEATDDVGIANMTLRMRVLSPKPEELKAKPYRDGMSFRRESDGSYPTQLQYKDFVELANLKPDGEAGANFKIEPGMEIEYWLVATDNCDVPPGPNVGISQKQRVKITKPVTEKPQQQLQQEKQQKLEQARQQHEKDQDKRNQNEQRKAPQPQPKGDPQRQQEKQKQQGDQQQGDDQKQQQGGNENNGQKKDGQPMKGDAEPNAGNAQDGAEDPELKKQDDEIKRANEAQARNNGGTQSDPDAPPPKPNMGDPKQGPKPDMGDPKQGPKPDMGDPKQGPKPDTGDPKQGPKPDTGDPKQGPKPDTGDPKQGPKPDMGDQTKPPKKDPSAEAQEFNDLADKLNSDDPKEREEAREQVKRMMNQSGNGSANPDDQKQKREKLRDDLDGVEKQKFDESMKRIQEEMQKLQQEKLEREKRVEQAAEKAKSDDPQKHAEGQKEMERELQNQSTRDEVNQKLQSLADGTKDAKQRQNLDDARTASRNNVQKQDANQAPPTPKKNDVDELAKKMQKGTSQEKQDAKDELAKKLQDPKQRDQTRKELDNFKKGLSGDERKDFEKQTKQMEDDAARKDPAMKQPLPKPSDVQKLADDLKSNDAKTKEQARNTLRQSMEQAKKNPPNPEQQRQDLDKHRDSLDKVEKENFDQAMQDVQKEMQNLQREDRVKSAAEKAKSNDPTQHAQGQKDIEKELQNPETRDDVNRELQQLAGDTPDPKQKKNLEDAINASRNNVQQQAAKQPPKKNNTDELAKKLQKGTPAEQQEAKDKLEKKLQDPKQSEQAKKDLENYGNGLAGEQKKDFDKKMQQMKDEIAKKNSGGSQSTPKPEDIQNFAKQLTSDNKQERQDAQRQLEEAMKQADMDPNARADAQKEITKVRDGIKDQGKKDQFDQAMGQIGKAVDKQRQDQQAANQKAQRQTAEQIANDLNSGDPAKEQAAQQKLEDALKDPKNGQAVKNELDKLKKNADAGAKKKIDDAVHQAEEKIAKGADQAGPKKEDIQQIAKDLNSGDAAKQKDAQQKLDEMFKDPNQRGIVKNEMEKIKKDMSDQAAKQKIDEAMKKADENLAKKDGPAQPSKDDLRKLAGDLNSKDAGIQQAAQQKLEDLLKDRQSGQAVKDELKNIAREDPQAKPGIDNALRQAEQNLAKKGDAHKIDPKDVQKLIKDMQSKDLKDIERAEKKLNEIMNDPAKREDFQNQVGEMLKDPQQSKEVRQALEKLKEIAKQNPGKSGDVVDHTGKKPADNETTNATPGSVADLKNRFKAGELTLERFKKNITNEEFRKELGWTDEQIAAYMKKKELQLKALNSQIEAAQKDDSPTSRTGKSSLNGGVEKIDADPKESSGASASGKFIAPPGFSDPYRRFTDEMSGNQRTSEPKR
jgi:hypothetical protein